MYNMYFKLLFQDEPPKPKKAKPRRKKKQSVPDQVEAPPPKLPVPEISPSMQKLQQIGQVPSQTQPKPSGQFDPAAIRNHTSQPSSTSTPTGMHQFTSSACVDTSMTTPFSQQTPTMTTITPPPGTTVDTGKHKQSQYSKHPVISPTNQNSSRPPIATPGMKDNNHSQIEEIQRRFIEQQRSVSRKDSSSSNTTPKSASQPQDSKKQQQVFFPGRVPVHPSQQLRKKRQSGLSPTTPSPTSMKPPPSPSSSGMLPMSDSHVDEKHPFTSQPELHQLALDAMQNKAQKASSSTSQPTQGGPDTPKHQQPKKSAFSTLFDNNDVNKTQQPPTHQQQPENVFNPSHPAEGSTNSNSGPSDTSAETAASAAQTAATAAGFVSPAEHQKEMERKKQLVKMKRKEEKDKAVLERKKARELEKQKRLEERAKQKELRDKQKAEKIQERRIIKQKQMQARALANEAKRKLQKMSQMAKQQQKASIVAPATAPTVHQTVPVKQPVEKVAVSSPAALPPQPTPTPPKIPLCEPDAQASIPIVQPIGLRETTDVDVLLTGKFGVASFDGFDDIYGEKKLEPIEILQDISGAVTMLNDVPLFASPERMDLCEDDVLGGVSNNPDDSTAVNTTEMEEDTSSQDAGIPEEYRKVLMCNQCYGPLPKNVVHFIDRGFEEISEGVFDQNDILKSDQLAFCSNDCVELYQGNIDYTIDEDVALVDAVKACAMVCLDEERIFLPLPSNDSRGNQFAPGMDGGAHVPPYKKRWRRWHFPFINTEKKKSKKTRLEREDLYKLMSKYDIRIKMSDDIKDRRVCMLCNMVGDGETAQSSRLLNYDVDQWVHLNCALWSNEVYEALNGGLHNVDKAKERAATTRCAHCQKVGASITCSHTFGAQQRLHCEKIYHFCCALQAQCAFYKDKVCDFLYSVNSIFRKSMKLFFLITFIFKRNSIWKSFRDSL